MLGSGPGKEWVLRRAFKTSLVEVFTVDFPHLLIRQLQVVLNPNPHFTPSLKKRGAVWIRVKRRFGRPAKLRQVLQDTLANRIQKRRLIRLLPLPQKAKNVLLDPRR